MIRINNLRAIGAVNGWMIATVSLAILFIGTSGLAVWAYSNYSEQKKDVDIRIEDAVTLAEKEQADKDAATYEELSKRPNLQFVGPGDYGTATFEYPKTWAVYVAKDTTNGGSFEAYLNPVTVPPVSSTQQFALRVVIEEKDYDRALAEYDSRVKKGDLKTSTVKAANGSTGTRVEGKFSNDIRGAAVLFKIRDKTLTLRSDANTFLNDFNNLIKTIEFNL